MRFAAVQATTFIDGSGPARASAASTAEAILATIKLRSNLVAADHLSATTEAQLVSDVNESQLLAIRRFIAAGRPIELVLPAFPAKSPNPEKTIGPDPDLGELLALQSLDALCHDIGRIYAPGARLIICSDGRVFSDLVLVPDEHVDGYKVALRNLIEDFDLTTLETFNLEEVYQRQSYAEMRQELVRDYATPLPQLMAEAKQDMDLRRLFNGIHRFVSEDRFVLQRYKSRSAVRREAHTVAYEVIQRSNAWSRLVAAHFPGALRLSIHPQPAHSFKIGVRMLRTTDIWATPWHGAVLATDDDYVLVKRRDAEALGARLAWHEGRLPYFAR